jgi:hypothetical protein
MGPNRIAVSVPSPADGNRSIFLNIVTRYLEGPKLRWVDNIKMDLGEMGWCHVDWIGLAKDRNMWRALVNSVLNLRVP